jgi:hypothetical protein
MSRMRLEKRLGFMQTAAQGARGETMLLPQWKNTWN